MACITRGWGLFAPRTKRSPSRSRSAHRTPSDIRASGISRDAFLHSARKESQVEVGIISDTHGLLRPEAGRALLGVDLILHAGDVGAPEILTRLRSIAPIFAVRGNVDSAPWAAELPATVVVEFAGATFYVLHNLRDLDLKPESAGIDAVISGHTHQVDQNLEN